MPPSCLGNGLKLKPLLKQMERGLGCKQKLLNY